jgi:hypothetical protein
MLSILRSVIYSSELWLCGDTNQIKDKEIYENYCRNIFNEARLANQSTTNSNRPKAGGPKKFNALLNNQRWNNTPTKKNKHRK